MTPITAADIADAVGARLEGDGTRVLSGVAPLGSAGPDRLTFLERASLLDRLAESEPGAVLVRDGIEVPEMSGAVLRIDRPEAAFARALELFYPDTHVPDIHQSAIIGRSVSLGEGVSIGPHAVIEDGARIGDACRIGPGVLIGAGVEMGRGCRVAHGVSVLSGSRLGDRVIIHEGSRIGTDGFGYAESDEGAVKIRQVGRCVIGDDVEIGANCAIDRGALGDTTIGARTKLDNLVHVAHNVQIGSDCMIVALVGIAGSSTVGEGAMLAGQVGVSGHCSIGAGAQISAKAGVIGTVPPGETWGGFPARPHREFMRVQAASLKLPRVLSRLKSLERRVEDDD